VAGGDGGAGLRDSGSGFGETGASGRYFGGRDGDDFGDKDGDNLGGRDGVIGRISLR
jgi:hypothetical protein